MLKMKNTAIQLNPGHYKTIATAQLPECINAIPFGRHLLPQAHISRRKKARNQYGLFFLLVRQWGMNWLFM